MRERFAGVALLTLVVGGCGGGKAPSMSTTDGGGGGVGGSGAGGTAGANPAGAGGAGGESSPPPEATLLEFLPLGVSADGSVVAGRSFQDQTAWRWTAATGTTSLAGGMDFDVRGISADGTTIIGNTVGSTGSHPGFIVGSTLTLIDLPRATDSEGAVVAVSNDGHTIAGNAWIRNPYFTTSQAFRWTADGGVQGLGFLPGDGASELVAMSPDGTTIVGLSYDVPAQRGRPFLWVEATGMTELSTRAASSLTVPIAVDDAGTAIGEAFGGGEVSFSNVTSATSRDAIVWMQGDPTPVGDCGSVMSTAFGITATGTILGGCGQSTLFLATTGGNARPLSLPPAPFGYSASILPVGLSGDGTVVAGRYDLGSLGGTANLLAVWTGSGTLPGLLAPKLTGMPGSVDLFNPVATSLSSDGTTLVGWAGGPAGWLLRLP